MLRYSRAVIWSLDVKSRHWMTHNKKHVAEGRMLIASCCQCICPQALARTQPDKYAMLAQQLAESLSIQITTIHGSCQQLQSLYTWASAVMAAWPHDPTERKNQNVLQQSSNWPSKWLPRQLRSSSSCHGLGGSATQPCSPRRCKVVAAAAVRVAAPVLAPAAPTVEEQLVCRPSSRLTLCGAEIA